MPQAVAQAAPQAVVFLLDVDDTLLDNDRIVLEWRAQLQAELGVAGAARFWSLSDAMRAASGYVDYPGALRRFGDAADPPSRRMLSGLLAWLMDYPFPARLYPGALAVIRHLAQWGDTVVLSDGDDVYQPRKIALSGLRDAVAGRVLVAVHKEAILDTVQRTHPARHYVMVDDKLRVLAAMKSVLGARLTTVSVRQGHYALDPAECAAHPAADLQLPAIADLLQVGRATLLHGAPGPTHGAPPPTAEETR